MLNRIRRGQRWLTMIFVGVIGLVFVFFLGLGGPLEGPSAGVIVELDDIRLDLTDFERTRASAEDRYRQALGDQFDATGASEFLDSQALQELIQAAILAHSASELGLVVSKQEIQQLLRNSPNFRDADGRFAREAFESWAEYTYGSQRNFLAVMRRDLLRQKMIRLLYSQTQVSDGEARSSALHRLEEIEIALVILDTERLSGGESADDATADAYLAANEAAVREEYEARAALYATPERVRARHLMVKLDRSADEDETAVANVLLAEALERLNGGEAFETVAAELSEDPGTKDQGGDLGVFSRGDRIPELEAAAFSLEPGELSEPIRSDAGLHIVRLDERVLAGRQDFEDVARQLARDLADASAANERATRLSEELSAAIREGRALQDEARKLELPINRPEAMRRRADGFVTGLGAAPEVMATAFALTEQSPSSPQVFRVGPKLALVQLLARRSPEPEALAEATANEKTRLLATKRNRAIQGWIDADQRTLNEAGRLKIDSSIVSGS